jgi:DNA-binding response OmpR family regulator
VAEVAKAPRRHDNAGRVLVIDDDPHMRELLTRFLGRNGMAVTVAPDGEAGLAAARESRPSAVLLDVMMPRMDGWAVLSALKSDPALADIPVIMISMMRDKGLAYSLGAAEYLTKPVDWQRLKEAVERHRSPSMPGLALVVEDDPATREELGGVLVGQGWEVAAAPDAAVARERVAERRPDLVLVNLDGPAVDGFTLLRELRRNPGWRTIPVIALAEGDLSPEDGLRLREQVTQVIATGEDGAEELLAELKRIAAERSGEQSGELAELRPAHGMGEGDTDG